jgi:hypothetical protein
MSMKKRLLSWSSPPGQGLLRWLTTTQPAQMPVYTPIREKAQKEMSFVRKSEQNSFGG